TPWIVDFSLELCDGRKRSSHHFGAEKGSLPRSCQGIASEKRDIDRQPGGHSPSSVAAVEIVQPERDEVFFGLLQRLPDNLGKVTFACRLKSGGLPEKHVAQFVIFVLLIPERRATICRCELFVFDSRNPIDA